MNLLALDIGLSHVGVALFRGGRLIDATTVSVSRGAPLSRRGPVAWRRMAKAVVSYAGGNIDVCVAEVMQIDKRSTPAVAEDLLELNGVCGWTMAMVGASKVVGYKPTDWKGSRPKDVEHRYIRKILDAEELAVIHDDTHDAWDAIGIGAHYLRKTGSERWQRR